ncbi:carbonate dehydratase [Candidatus Gracilibacteria bacterium CG17_big_fil_post_rev_8_21_14_2_50_48_13]|nr:MAG: carbonate dehydratase [Candidatus Gracilibacteria bacterium CG17_big_fil_post_rev_8_21_14_2_50_48_13]
MSLRNTASNPPSEKFWEMDFEAVLKHYTSSRAGLSKAEAERRLSVYGPNALPPAASRPAILRFLAQFNNVLIYVLLTSALITGLGAHYLDTAVILGVVFLNALIGFIQEGKAERALASMNALLEARCTALRGGEKVDLAVEQLVPGDIVLLQAGDKIPADLRLLESVRFAVDESMLTGESIPVEKKVAAIQTADILAERINMGYSGTLVTRGTATGIVTATGPQTELGNISRLLDTTESIKTPLLQVIDRFGGSLSLVLFLVAAGTFAVGTLVRGLALDTMFLAAVGLFVAAIPEGLPAIITITLALGVRKMAQKNAVVRKLPAVESLGAVTVICTDKTGTLTQNAMTVTMAETRQSAYTFAGSGYDPHGIISPAATDELRTLLELGVLCNDAGLLPPTEGLGAKGWHIVGDPTEAALLVAAQKAGIEQKALLAQLPRTDALPFSSETKVMVTLHHDHQGACFIVIKGATEEILKRCSTLPEETTEAHWLERSAQRAEQGERTLGFAIKHLPKAQEILQERDAEHGFSFVGFVSISDPPRESAKRAVAQCRSAGIVVKMITGDHALTAEAIAQQVGIEFLGPAVTGEMLEGASEKELLRLVRSTNVFARVNPEHKLRLVEALQKDGELVAMTGDGVNDAPALRRADIGISMGKNGTEVAREASRMVLLDDAFETIVSAVSTGRTVYDNIMKSLVFILPTSFAEALLIVLAIALGFPLPITPLQILWVNLVTEVSLSLALAMEEGEADIMQRKPRAKNAGLFGAQETLRTTLITVIFITLSLISFVVTQNMQGSSLILSQTVMVNMVVLLEIVCLLSTRSLSETFIQKNPLVGNRPILLSISIVFVLQLLFTYLPVMQDLFGTTHIGVSEWILLLALSLLGFLLMELEKPLRRYLLRRK